jgi:hypothetical protein
MRIVSEPNGETWICLQVPERPDTAAGTVLVECNSGAERVELVLRPGWEETGEAEMIAAIRAGIQRSKGSS